MTFELSTASREVLVSAKRAAMRRRQVYCDVDHLVEALLKNVATPSLLRELSDDLERLAKLPFDPPHVEFSRNIQEEVLPSAAALAQTELSATIEPNHLLQAAISEESPLATNLKQKILANLQQPNSSRDSQPLTVAEPAHVASEGAKVQANDFLVVYETIPPSALIARPDYLDRTLIALLTGSAMIVGPEGSGRSSVTKLVIAQLQDQDRPEQFRQFSVWKISLMNLIAGTTYRGELEERLKTVVERLQSLPGIVVVVVNDIHLLVNDRDGTADVATVLVPLMASGKIRILGYCTQGTFREKLERNSSFCALLQLIRLESCRPEEATTLLQQLSHQVKSELGVDVPPALITEAIKATLEYMPQIALPGGAARLVKAAAAKLAFETSMLRRFPERRQVAYWRQQEPICLKEGECPVLTPRHLLHSLSEQNGIPFEHLDKNIGQRIIDFKSAFSSQIYGQDHILEPLESTLSVSLAGLSDPLRPRGKFFFMGPPGTGKTESARLIASFLMGQEQALLRFDMSEFQDRSSVSTLIGSDKGLVGSHEGGRLTEPLRINPHRVLLFDEIEKADRSIYNLFLQILDNGIISDKLGNAVSFRHAILLFTSNAGSNTGESLDGYNRKQLTKILEAHFLTEFLNRMDYILPFRPLDEQARENIVRYQLRQLRAQLASVHGVDLEWDERVIKYGAQDHDKEPGARQILRWIQDRVKPRIASKLLVHSEIDQTKPALKITVDEDLQLQANYLRAGESG